MGQCDVLFLAVHADPKDQHPSPKRSATRVSSAAASASASGPEVLTSIEVPLEAANIKSPMMLSPEAVIPSLRTSAVASKPSTTSTNFADARACKPFSFMMFNARCAVADMLAGLPKSLNRRSDPEIHLDCQCISAPPPGPRAQHPGPFCCDFSPI